MSRQDGDRTDLIAAHFDVEGRATVWLDWGVDYSQERQLWAERHDLDHFPHQDHPGLGVRFSMAHRIRTLGKGESIHKMLVKRALPWFRGSSTRKSVRRKLLLDEARHDQFLQTLLYPHPGSHGRLKAIDICLVLNEQDEARRLLMLVVDDYLRCNPLHAYSRIDPPWWAHSLWQTLRWAKHHELLSDFPPLAIQWMHDCMAVEPKLSAAIGLLGAEAQARAEKGHWRSRRFCLEAMVEDIGQPRGSYPGG